MKKTYHIFLLILFLLLSITPIHARAGGGGFSGGSGGSSSSRHRRSSHSNTNGDNLINFAFVGIFIVGSGYSAYVYRYKIYVKKHASKDLMKKLRSSDPFWQEEHIKAQVEQVYFVAQSAWTQKDLSPLKPYVSEELYEKWRMKIDWMDVRHERNILENIKLLSTNIVSVYDSKVNDHDMLWVCIRGKMVDYLISEEDRQILQGNRFSHEFVEYWKFIRKDNTILLDEILQKDEVDIDSFIDFSEQDTPSDIVRD